MGGYNGSGSYVSNSSRCVLNWKLSHRFDKRALPLANRHYNRQKPDSPQFVPPGACMVLLTDNEDALWVTSWPKAEYVKHEWAGAWVNTLFRNEGELLSSDLILEAVAASKWFFDSVPEIGLITFVDASKVISTNPGYCYLRAGFKRVGKTKGGLIALLLSPDDMPAARAPLMA